MLITIEGTDHSFIVPSTNPHCCAHKQFNKGNKQRPHITLVRLKQIDDLLSDYCLVQKETTQHEYSHLIPHYLIHFSS